MTRQTVAVDVDGVLHAYDGVWGALGEPVPGAIDWLNRITRAYDVAIHSTRCNNELGLQLVEDWLGANHLTKGAMKRISVTKGKPPALVYLDDRAWRFDGTNFPTRQQIAAAKPWWKE